MENVEMTRVAGKSESKYFISEIKGSTVVEVQFSDGTKNKYAGDKTLKIGDVFVVGPGYKSSYAMGAVTAIASSAGKTGHLAKSVMTFKKNPQKSDVKKCFDGIKPIKTMEDIRAFLPYDYFGSVFSS